MPLPIAPLDDRTFQDLVDELRKKIPLYAPEWTDHNVSDPGITLLELFAWLTDILLYRANQIPDRHYVKLLDLLGIQLEPPLAAAAPLTFYLSAPQPVSVTIPRGTAVSTSRAETGSEETVVFTTDDDLAIEPARLDHLLVRRRQADGSMKYQEIGLRRLQREFTPFSPEPPQEGEALLFGFDDPLDHHVLGLDLTCVRAGGQNIIPESPPLAWQVWSDGAWREAELELDGTGGMSWSGQVWLHLPTMTQREAGGIQAYWVRCEVIKPAEEQRAYATSPIVREVLAMSWGATVQATHATKVANEPLGRSDGTPGQVFGLEHTPLLPRREDERVEIWQTGMASWEPWQEVEDFSQAGGEDRHYTLDAISGELRFGPALRQRDGTVRRYGAIPPRGADIRFSSYRYGGGTTGNVRSGAISELQTPYAYVARVLNRQPARGGLDAETLEQAIFRARGLLRSRYRAVTVDDYEQLVLDQFPEVARALCMQTALAGGRSGSPTPGQVYVLVIPAVPLEEAGGYIPLAHLGLSDELCQRIAAYLDERRLLTTTLEVRAASYKRVRVQARVVARPGTDEQRLGSRIVAALQRFLNPLGGGPEGKGWPFGRELYLSDLYVCIQNVEGLLYVQDVEVFTVDETDTPHRVERKLDLLGHEVIVSDLHQVQVVRE
jgi:predicted phage baseplate assembly protein